MSFHYSISRENNWLQQAALSPLPYGMTTELIIPRNVYEIQVYRRCVIIMRNNTGDTNLHNFFISRLMQVPDIALQIRELV